jgi:DNA invertase Pin-like site-specific DNA recombinase
MSDKLRFGVLIRVSTVKQKDRGESLRVQETQIREAVATLGGEITRIYSGQEHGTADHERLMLDQLLADAASKTKPFDAVMVFDASRWSRDNQKSKEGLAILRKHGVRFFVHSQEYNLFDSAAILFLGMSGEIGEFQAREQRRKSVLSTIARAKRLGAPTAGKKPYGRTYDPETQTWGIDAAKHEIIKDVAERYLKGESMVKLAQEHGINDSYLAKTLKESCGDSYIVRWDVKDLNIKAEVSIEIPRLLPEETIEAIRQRAQANKTYFAKRGTHQRYLLSGFVRCAQCGYAMSGHWTNRGIAYYRHGRTDRGHVCDAPISPYVDAASLEAAVIGKLFDIFGNPRGMERAIELAFPNQKKLDESRAKLERFQKQLAKLDKARGNILNLIVRGSLSEDQADAKLREIGENERTVQAEIDQLNRQFETGIPSAEDIRNRAAEIQKRWDASPAVRRARAKFAERLEGMTDAEKNAWIASRNVLNLMSWKDARHLVESVFGGNTIDGKPLGVYVVGCEGKRGSKTWHCVIRGMDSETNLSVTNQASGSLQMTLPLPRNLGKGGRFASRFGSSFTT